MELAPWQLAPFAAPKTKVAAAPAKGLGHVSRGQFEERLRIPWQAAGSALLAARGAIRRRRPGAWRWRTLRRAEDSTTEAKDEMPSEKTTAGEEAKEEKHEEKKEPDVKEAKEDKKEVKEQPKEKKAEEEEVKEEKEKTEEKEVKEEKKEEKQEEEEVKEEKKEEVKEEKKEEKKEEVKEEKKEEVKEETNEEVKEEKKEEKKEEVKEEKKEEVKEEKKEEKKEEVKEETKEEVKEKTKEEVKEEAKEEAKEETKEEAKEETKEEVKEETKEEVTEETKEEEKEEKEDKEEVKEEVKEEEKEEVKEETKEEVKKETKAEVKEEKQEKEEKVEKEEVKEEKNEEVKEEKREEVKDEPEEKEKKEEKQEKEEKAETEEKAKEVKEEKSEEVKEEKNEEVKDEKNEEVKEEVTEEVKEEVKEEKSKDEKKEEVKEEEEKQNQEKTEDKKEKEETEEKIEKVEKEEKGEKEEKEEKTAEGNEEKQEEVKEEKEDARKDKKEEIKEEKEGKEVKEGSAEKEDAPGEKKDSDDDAEAEKEAKARKADLEMPAGADEESSMADRQATQVAEVLKAQEESEEKVGKASGISGKELREMKEQVKEMFDWNRAWYPIAPLEYLNADAPNAVKLLGKRMVLWCSNQEKNLWHAALDACPHRMAPLSIGSIKDGCLKCRYHGWTFSTAGSCVAVPMAQNGKEEARMCALSRSSLTTFPVQVKQGLVWIFPYLGPDVETVSKRSGPCVTPECEGTEWVMTTAPVGYQVSVENTFDPSHAPFMHHGIGTYSPERAIPMSKFELRDDEISGKRGFVLEHNGYDEGTEGLMATRQFVPPCSNTTVYKHKDRRTETTQLYFVPCGPHETRYIVNVGQQVNKKLPQIAQDILHVLFFNKIFGYRFQEQDLLAMRGQERSLHECPQFTWGEQYVLGTPSDKGVEVFRKWWYDCANGGPYFPRASRTLPASDPMIFDRWQRHAKDCPRCKRVMKAFGHVQTAAGRLSVLGLALATGCGLLRKPQSCCGWLLTTLLLAALGRWAAAERWGFVSSVPLKGLMEVPVYKSGAMSKP
ncbi:unnamed protein product [Cladocopium goreaui]|uniref:Rieske domain-containing protein n=1 Tax=Cladocopium goreaui TaxID=2562237 RepID=A0A9P1GBT3_9DINO|nr:unnamed protein product [Cladocopium goreaui]